MDKRTFMKKLEQSLSVLQEDELKDILSEYEQHVDMKVKSGLTEEEAIADFGRLSELVAEILEAYHVRADYARADYVRTDYARADYAQTDYVRTDYARTDYVRADYAEDEPGNGNAATAEKIEKIEGNEKPEKKEGPERIERTEKIKKVRAACKKAGEKLAAGAKGAGVWIWGAFLFLVRLAGTPFRWGAGVLKSWTNRYKKRLAEGRMESDRESFSESRGKKFAGSRAGILLLKRITGLVLGVLRLVTGIVIWAVRMAWNVCCVGFSLFCGLFGLFCLFGFGMLAVLLLQRYPLAGLTVACFGVMVCMFSAAWLGLTLLWRKKEKVSVGTDRENGPMAEAGEL